jgi:rubrerythrin
MALFDEIGKKITNAGQSVVKGTKDLAETARINSQISEEQKQLGRLYAQLGKLYFEQIGGNPEAPFHDICEAIAAAEGRIAGYQHELQQIKGTKLCANCGAEITDSSAFCPMCGTPVPVSAPATTPARRFCSNCGSELESGAAFCLSCGQKIED